MIQKINFVKNGNEVEIRLDSAPDASISGVVREVATFSNAAAVVSGSN